MNTKNKVVSKKTQRSPIDLDSARATHKMETAKASYSFDGDACGRTKRKRLTTHFFQIPEME
jgi:hypothetical protein